MHWGRKVRDLAFWNGRDRLASHWSSMNRRHLSLALSPFGVAPGISDFMKVPVQPIGERRSLLGRSLTKKRQVVLDMRWDHGV